MKNFIGLLFVLGCVTARPDSYFYNQRNLAYPSASSPFSPAASPYVPAPVNKAPVSTPSPYTLPPSSYTQAPKLSAPVNPSYSSSALTLRSSLRTISVPAPFAAAGLAYIKAKGNSDICANTIQIFLETLSQQGSTNDALLLAQKYFNDKSQSKSNGLTGACREAQRAAENAIAIGNDPAFAATIAYINSQQGSNRENLCAIAGEAYYSALKNRKSESKAFFLAAKSFANALQSQAASGTEINDRACAAAVQAYIDNDKNLQSNPNTASLVLLASKSLKGFSITYDPVCWKAGEAYLNSYLEGKDELHSKIIASEIFLDELVRNNANIPSDSPCTAAALAYAENSPAFVTSPYKNAVDAFIRQIVSSGSRAPDAVCIDAAKAYISAYKVGGSEQTSLTAAIEAVIRSLSTGNAFSADSPCAVAAKSFIASADTPDHPFKSAISALIDSVAIYGDNIAYDPICGNAALAYINAYKAGKSETASLFEAFLTVIDSSKQGNKIDANSPCIKTIANVAKTSQPSGDTLTSSMLAYVSNYSNLTKPDPVCLATIEAYVRAYVAGRSEEDAIDIAGGIYLDGVAATPTFDANSPCAQAARKVMESRF